MAPIGKVGARRRPSSNNTPLQPVPAARTPAARSSTRATAANLASSQSTRPSTRSTAASTSERPVSEGPLDPESEEEPDRIYPPLAPAAGEQSDAEDRPQPTPPVLRSATNLTGNAPAPSTPAVAASSSRSNSSDNSRERATFQATEVALSTTSSGRSQVSSSLLGPPQLPLPRPQRQQSMQPIPSTVQPLPAELITRLISVAQSPILTVPGLTGVASQHPGPAVTAAALPSSHEPSVAYSVHGGSRTSLSGQKRPSENGGTQDDEVAREQRRKEKKKKHNDARPRLSDYNNDASHAEAITLAITYMKIETATATPFPNKEHRQQTASESFSRALEALELSPEAYTLDVKQMRLISGEDGNTRSAIRKAVEPLVGPHYGLVAGPTSQEALANRERVSFLLENSRFHFKDPAHQQGMFQNELVAKAIMAAWFSHSNALGCIYQERFNPISLESIALILTIIRHSLSQWEETGKCEKRALRGDEYIYYDDLLEAMFQYRGFSAIAAQTLQTYRTRLFKRALANAGVKESESDRAPIIQITDDAMEAEMEWQAEQDALENEEFA